MNSLIEYRTIKILKEKNNKLRNESKYNVRKKKYISFI